MIDMTWDVYHFYFFLSGGNGGLFSILFLVVVLLLWFSSISSWILYFEFYIYFTLTIPWVDLTICFRSSISCFRVLQFLQLSSVSSVLFLGLAMALSLLI